MMNYFYSWHWSNSSPFVSFLLMVLLWVAYFIPSGVGLVLHAIKSRARGTASNVPETKVRGDKRNILDRMKGWFDEL